VKWFVSCENRPGEPHSGHHRCIAVGSLRLPVDEIAAGTDLVPHLNAPFRSGRVCEAPSAKLTTVR
jgi:hypothetical protein